MGLSMQNFRKSYCSAVFFPEIGHRMMSPRRFRATETSDDVVFSRLAVSLILTPQGMGAVRKYANSWKSSGTQYFIKLVFCLAHDPWTRSLVPSSRFWRSTYGPRRCAAGGSGRCSLWRATPRSTPALWSLSPPFLVFFVRESYHGSRVPRCSRVVLYFPDSLG